MWPGVCRRRQALPLQNDTQCLKKIYHNAEKHIALSIFTSTPELLSMHEPPAAMSEEASQLDERLLKMIAIFVALSVDLLCCGDKFVMNAALVYS